MALSWSGRRQLLYYAVAGVLGVVILWAGYESFFTAPPTCFDGRQNGDEHGVDCGGNSCSLVCTQDVKPPAVLWSRTFKVAQGTYTAAAYVQSGNLTAGAKNVPYSFQLFDANNSLIVERDGLVNIPPIQIMPIVEVNIDTGARVASRALFAFGATPVWHTAQVPALGVGGEQLAADGSRLTATITNGTLFDVPGVTVVAVLFDSAGTAIAASKSILNVPKQGSQAVIFTWPAGTPGVARGEVTVLPPF